LTSEEFENYVEKNDVGLVNFIKPYSRVCQEFNPEYENATRVLKERGIMLAAVDCAKEGQLCRRYDVDLYPTLKIFRSLDESPDLYTGARTSEEIVSFMVKQSYPLISKLDNAAMDAFKAAESTTVIGFLAENDQSALAEIIKAAEELRGHSIFGTINDLIESRKENVITPSLIVYKDFGTVKRVLTGEFKAENILRFVRIASLPLIGDLNAGNYAYYVATSLPIAYIFMDTSMDHQSLIMQLEPVAKDYTGTLNFATADINTFPGLAASCGLKKDQVPALAIHDLVRREKYLFPPNNAISEASIRRFI
ncbi:thioredoxin-like domain-containing protein, partial [Xylogone sp. PMI_703]